MLKHLFLVAVMVLGLSISLEASQRNQESKYYVVIKGLYGLGEKINEDEDTTLEGEAGFGFGIDFGYKITHNLALEFDLSFDENDVTEESHGHSEVVEGTYYTYAIDLAYTYHITHNIGIMGKAGVEVEDERINALGIDKRETGLAYGVALEYVLNSDYEIVAEYEGTTIESPRGHSLFFGVKYNF